MRRGHEGRLAALGRAGLQRAERDSGKVRARMCMAPRVVVRDLNSVFIQ